MSEYMPIISYTHLILALGIAREPTVWGFITSQYPGIHDIDRATLITVSPTVGRRKPAVARQARPCKYTWFSKTRFGRQVWIVQAMPHNARHGLEALFMRHCLENSPANSLPKCVFEKVYRSLESAYSRC